MAIRWRFDSKGSPSSKIKSVGGMGGSQSTMAAGFVSVVMSDRLSQKALDLYHNLPRAS